VEVTISGKPYIENGDVRTFSVEQAAEEFVWHRDKEDRKITVVEGEAWQFQLHEKFPVLLEKGKEYNIPKLVHHRLIKGKTDLVLKIDKQ
tara:strand:+ start:668 stop:937 length:270 start_codon:yes stop_codon:yes gene_type:complete